MINTQLLLHFSDIYRDSLFVEKLREQGLPFSEIDFSGLEGTSCYLDAEAETEIRSKISDRSERIHWLDSGDYHYMTKLFCEDFSEPFSLLLFDHHPDDQPARFDGVLSCGSWVRELRQQQRALQQVFSIGPEGGPLCLPEQVSGVEHLYLSIDKDVLSPDFARTDWSQGELRLDELFAMLDSLWDWGVDVLGVDICGGLSRSKGATPEDLSVNLASDLALAQYFYEKMK